MLVVNRIPGDPTAMGQGASPDGVQPTVPAVHGQPGRRARAQDQERQSTSISPDLAYFDSGNDYIQADFSSQGPTDVDFRVKPDVMAPGLNVLSSVPGDCGAIGCWAFFGGTSMATPHLAGAAAVVRGQHPTWTAAQVRSAIVNTAAVGSVKAFAGGPRSPTSTSSGPACWTCPPRSGLGRDRPGQHQLRRRAVGLRLDQDASVTLTNLSGSGDRRSPSPSAARWVPASRSP